MDDGCGSEGLTAERPSLLELYTPVGIRIVRYIIMVVCVCVTVLLITYIMPFTNRVRKGLTPLKESKYQKKIFLPPTFAIICYFYNTLRYQRAYILFQQSSSLETFFLVGATTFL